MASRRSKSTSRRATQEVAARVRSLLVRTIQTMRARRDDGGVVLEEERPLPSFTLPFEFGALDAAGRPEFRVDTEIGHGQSANVYRGIYQRLSTAEQTCDVAIKFYREIRDPLQAEDARSEALRADRVRDDRVVRIRTVGLLDHRWPFVVQDFHQALNLEEWALQAMADRTRLPSVEQCTRIVLDAARGVQAAHQCDVIHRDIAPRNLLVCADGVTRITDFGCAALGERSSDSMVVGTPGFMPPEQWLQGARLRQSDVAALGGILYWLLTGRLPYGDSTKAIAQAHADPETSQRIRGRALRRSRVPAEIAEAILGATCPNLLDRTASVAEFADRLEAWLDPEVPPVEVAAPRRTWPALAGTATLLLAATLGWVALSNRGTPPPMVTDAAVADAMGLHREDPALVTLIHRLCDFGSLPFDTRVQAPDDLTGAAALTEAHADLLLANDAPAIRMRTMLAFASLALQTGRDDRFVWWLASAQDLFHSPASNYLDEESTARICELIDALKAMRWVAIGGLEGTRPDLGPIDSAIMVRFHDALVSAMRSKSLGPSTGPNSMLDLATTTKARLETVPVVKVLAAMMEGAAPPPAPPTAPTPSAP